MMDTLLMERVFMLAEAESFGGGQVSLPPVLGGMARRRAPRWSSAEREFLTGNIGNMADEQIGEALGRSGQAIKIKRQRWGLPAHSKRPGWLTGHKAAKALGIDIHAVMALTARGILPHVRIPGRRGILNIQKRALYQWALNPGNWVYFRIEQVRELHLRQLLERKREQWPDEWWTVGRVAEYHGVDYGLVNKYIRLGHIPAARYGNWWVLRSEAMKAHFCRGRGYGHEFYWNEAADAFLVLAAAVGMSLNAAGAMTHYGTKRASYRLRWLMRREDLAGLIERRGLPVQYDAARGMVHADWREQAGRFPTLARAMRRFEAGEALSDREAVIVRGVLAHEMDWRGIPGPRMVSVGRWGRGVVMGKLREMAEGISNQ